MWWSSEYQDVRYVHVEEVMEIAGCRQERNENIVVISPLFLIVRFSFLSAYKWSLFNSFTTIICIVYVYFLSLYSFAILWAFRFTLHDYCLMSFFSFMACIWDEIRAARNEIKIHIRSEKRSCYNKNYDCSSNLAMREKKKKEDKKNEEITIEKESFDFCLLINFFHLEFFVFVCLDLSIRVLSYLLSFKKMPAVESFIEYIEPYRFWWCAYADLHLSKL